MTERVLIDAGRASSCEYATDQLSVYRGYRLSIFTLKSFVIKMRASGFYRGLLARGGNHEIFFGGGGGSRLNRLSLRHLYGLHVLQVIACLSLTRVFNSC